jgi:hypothetical protein
LHQNLKQLRGFLGLTRYYRRFVKGYGAICKPLTQLLKKVATTWNDKATREISKLKELIINALVLYLPDLNKVFVMEIDALLFGVVVVLM